MKYTRIILSENQNDILEEILDYHYRQGDDENNPTMGKCNDFYSTTWEFGRQKRVYRKKDFYFQDEDPLTYTESGYHWVEFRNMNNLNGAIKFVDVFIKHLERLVSDGGCSSRLIYCPIYCLWFDRRSDVRVAKLLLNRLNKANKQQVKKRRIT